MIDRQRRSDDENFPACPCEGEQRGEGVCTGVRLRIHLIHRKPHLHLFESSSQYKTSEGADKCLQEKRKTINGEDILSALRSLGFDNYEGVLTVYLAKLREVGLSILDFRAGESLIGVVSDGIREISTAYRG